VIVNISSTAGHYPSVGLGPYNVAKAAVLMLTRSAALEWARDGIRVVGIAPGKIDTEMVQPIVQYVEERGLALNPLGRLGAPEEVAELVAYLVSDHASFMTGTTITFDGGEMVGTAGLGS
jgi:NAD(P)-dependent dehydrogenase (short-subunit alcohol dehydrogenase family)